MGDFNAELVLMKLSYISVADIEAGNGLAIVCEVSSNLNAAGNVSTRDTKCGLKTSVGNPTISIAGNGIAHVDLVGNQVSAQKILEWIIAKTLLYFVYQNSASGTNTVGEGVNLKGSGRFSSVTITSDSADPLTTFDWEFSVGENPSYVP